MIEQSFKLNVTGTYSTQIKKIVQKWIRKYNSNSPCACLKQTTYNILSLAIGFQLSVLPTKQSEMVPSLLYNGMDAQESSHN